MVINDKLNQFIFQRFMVTVMVIFDIWHFAKLELNRSMC